MKTKKYIPNSEQSQNFKLIDCLVLLFQHQQSKMSFVVTPAGVYKGISPGLEISEFTLHSSDIVFAFTGITLTLFGLGWLYLSGKSLSSSTKLRLIWFLLSGTVHLFFESHFVLSHSKIAQSNSFLSQFWKEYSKADSRYLISDPATLAVEIITVFLCGPLCYLIFYLGSRKSRWEFVLQLICSIMFLYGDTIYFATEIIEDWKHVPTPSEDPIKFFFYYVLSNGFWVVIPILCVIQAISKLYQAMNHFEDYQKAATKKNA
jgi:cholestenol delta-isomerase